MSDILQRLRLLVPSDSSGAATEAADTITALTARVEELEGALNRAAHRLAGAMLSHYAHEAYSIADPRAASTKGERNE